MDSTHRLLNVVPGLVRGFVLARVVDQHAVNDVGELRLQLEGHSEGGGEYG